MKTAVPFSKHAKRGPVGRARVSKNYLAAMIVVLFGFGGIVSNARAQPTDNAESGAEVLTRGPVHEAFAGVVSYDPEPGVVVSNGPPNLIEEVPPEERPEGDNVAWIPGYWAWDDERNDFLWISGTWRALPPGREWMAGYWAQAAEGHQWISGYWADATVTETTYLPAPPQTVESGPNIAAPSDDHGWTPGCWFWQNGRYGWRPGYWTQGRADWDWIPAHYVWTPRGYIFVEGFWDYSVERRGILFAPVYFESRVYSRRGYHYSPTIVINLGVFSDHLFLRPRYHHYYFGDYYGSNYQQGGIYASFSFQSSRHGYDPFYSRQRWVHRRDRGWENRVAASYQYRRDHETARPPRTWSAQTRIDARSAESTQNRLMVATPINQLAKRKGSSVRFQPVAREERQRLGQRGQEVQRSREERRTLEARPTDRPAARADGAIEPVRIKHPRSPIVAKPADQLGRNRPPARAQQAPKPELERQPKADTPRRPQNTERRKPEATPRQPDAERRSSPERNRAVPRERQSQLETPPRSNATPPTSPEPAQRKARELEKKTQQEAAQDAKVTTIRDQEKAQRDARELQRKERSESVKPDRSTARPDKEESARPPGRDQRKDQKRRSFPPEETPAP